MAHLPCLWSPTIPDDLERKRPTPTPAPILIPGLKHLIIEFWLVMGRYFFLARVLLRVRPRDSLRDSSLVLCSCHETVHWQSHKEIRLWSSCHAIRKGSSYGWLMNLSEGAEEAFWTNHQDVSFWTSDSESSTAKRRFAPGQIFRCPSWHAWKWNLYPAVLRLSTILDAAEELGAEVDDLGLLLQ